MQPVSNLGKLKTADWQSIQDLVTRFETANQDSTAEAPLESFLPPGEHPLRQIGLLELIKSDLEVRWRRGKGLTIEDYLERFPELKILPSTWAKLLFEEFRVRQQLGDKPGLSGYRQRFPEQFRELEELVRQSDEGATIVPPSGTKPEPPPKPPAEQSTTNASQVVGGGYRLIKRIGSGSFGEVWRAEAPGGVAVALKVIFRPLDHEEAQRELQALELIKTLRHPYLAQTQAFWSQSDRLYIVMELADCSLRDRFKECQKEGLPGIPVQELVGYFNEAAEALDYLHNCDVLHRDIKPDNLLLVQPEDKRRDGKPASATGVRPHLKVGDFGLVRIWESQRLGASGAGTPAYMPPETWNGQMSRHGDQYSLAVTYAELRRGRPVFAGKNMYELMVECLSRDPDLSGLEEPEQQVLRKALNKDPNLRYGTCLEFVHELSKAVSPAPLPPAPPQGAVPDTVDFGTLRPNEMAGVAGSRPSWRPDTQRPGGGSTLTATPLHKRWLLIAFLLACVPAALLAYVLLFQSGTGGESESGVPYRLEAPPPLVLPAGQAGSVLLRVERHHFDEPIHLTFAGLPPGVTVADTILAGDATTVQAELKTNYETPPASTSVTVHAAAGEREQEVSFPLEVKPSLVYRPPGPGWEKVAGADVVTDAKSGLFYNKYDLVREGARFRFVLIPRRPEDTKNIATFYIMDNKVSVAQFRRFAKDAAQKLKGSQWKEKDSVGGDYPADSDPVFNVLVDDAYQFARWLSPSGNLPTIDQWDKAAGRFETMPGEGPYKASWDKKDPKQIAVSRGAKGPMKCGEATHDVSVFLCHDMAGNGREWTRNLDSGGLTVPQINPAPDARVLLRGHTFRGNYPPLTFEELKNAEQSDQQDTGFYRESSSDVGFRVVIEP